MAKIDQSRFNNQHSDWLDAKAAAALLDVKRATLYAYVSRGLVAARGQRRSRRYRRSDLEKLAGRRDARRGHKAVAADALRWGAPVLDSDISEISETLLRYRSHDVADLARERSFEEVAELLWSGELPAVRPTWDLARNQLRLARRSHRGTGDPIMRMRMVVPNLAAGDANRLGAGELAEKQRARKLIRALSSCVASEPASTIAETLVGTRKRGRALAVRAIDATLIACADHGLNVSTFAARVAASAGADLYAGCSAALSAFSGPLHGGASRRLEATLRSCQTPAQATRALREAADLGVSLPGFGHPLYPKGDVRAPILLELAKQIGGKRLGRLDNLRRAAARHDREAPNVDFGLVAIATALGLPPGHASALFAVGRCAGWIAHIFEQRRAGYLLRPRANTPSTG